MISHPIFGLGAIIDISKDEVLLKFQGFAVWVNRKELPCRVPAKKPRTKAEGEFLKRLGYTIPQEV